MLDAYPADPIRVAGHRISVVMPAHDEAETISGAIESILGQGVPELEILVITDRCSDNTADVASAYAGVRVVPCVGEGLVDALNTGVAASREIIVRLDADDRHHLGGIEALVRPMLQRPELGVVGGAICEVTPDGEMIEIVPPAADGRQAAFLSMVSPAFGHSAVAFRRDVVLGAGGYRGDDTVHAEDQDLWERLVTAGVEVLGVDVVVADRVVTVGSVSALHWASQAESSRRVSDRAIASWKLRHQTFRRVVRLGREVDGRQRTRLQVVAIRLARRSFARREIRLTFALVASGFVLGPRSLIAGTIAIRRNSARYRSIWGVDRLPSGTIT